MEHDEFRSPFQWIGRSATISVQLNPTQSILFICAGSPNFSGTRNISIRASGLSLSQEILPGWRAYQFDITQGTPSVGSVIKITITIDRLLEIQGDSRELGIMLREIHCRNRFVSGAEVRAIGWKQNIRNRVEYYSPAQAPGILWLASYPRSGNTWMRFLMTNLLFERVRESRTIAEYIDEIIDPLYNLRGANHRDIKAFGSNTAHIVKTHMPYSLWMPLRDKTVGAIYVLRNPLDVAVSLRKQYPDRSEEIAEQFLSYGIDTTRQLLNYGSWHSHVFSWLRVAKLSHSIPVLMVKYEDLIADPFTTCSRILSWLKIERPANLIYEAIEHSSITNLRNMESVETDNEKPGVFFTLEQRSEIQDGLRFLADGKSNNYREYLTDSEIRRGLTTFGPVMKEFNYA